MGTNKDIILKTTEHGHTVGLYSGNADSLVGKRFQVFKEEDTCVAIRHDGWPLWLHKSDIGVVDPILKIELSNHCGACPHWHWTLFRLNANDNVWCNTGFNGTCEKYELAVKRAGKAYNDYLKEYKQ